MTVRSLNTGTGKGSGKDGRGRAGRAEAPVLIFTRHCADSDPLPAEEWAQRLVDIAGAHARSERDCRPQIVECRVCPERCCVRIAGSVREHYPRLFRDLLGFAGATQAADHTASCPALYTDPPACQSADRPRGADPTSAAA